jgi:hypothetical protein
LRAVDLTAAVDIENFPLWYLNARAPSLNLLARQFDLTVA